MYSPPCPVPIESALTRRDFVRRLGAGMLAALVLPVSFRDPRTGPRPVSLFLASTPQSAYESVLGQDFRVDAGTRESPSLKLAQVRDGNASIQVGPNLLVKAAPGQCFVLSFVGPSDKPLPESTYVFEHARLGKSPLFIVRGSRDKSGQHYVALVNHAGV